MVGGWLEGRQGPGETDPAPGGPAEPRLPESEPRVHPRAPPGLFHGLKSDHGVFCWSRVHDSQTHVGERNATWTGNPRGAGAGGGSEPRKGWSPSCLGADRDTRHHHHHHPGTPGDLRQAGVGGPEGLLRCYRYSLWQRALGPWAGRTVRGLVNDVVPRMAGFWGQTGQPQQERGSKPRTAHRTWSRSGQGTECQAPKKSLPAFEESHVEDGGVGVDELQQESLEDQSLLEALLGLRDLCKERDARCCALTGTGLRGGKGPARGPTAGGRPLRAVWPGATVALGFGHSPILVSHLAMQPYTSSRRMMTTRLMMTAVAVTVTRMLDLTEGEEFMAKAAAVEIL